MQNLEHKHQAALFKWAKMNENNYPCLAYMFAIPNGGKRDEITAIKMKREGVKKGVPDIFLPIAIKLGGLYWHGLFIEMKSEKGRISEDQKKYLGYLDKNEYKTAVCYSWLEAIDVILDYLR